MLLYLRLICELLFMSVLLIFLKSLVFFLILIFKMCVCVCVHIVIIINASFIYSYLFFYTINFILDWEWREPLDRFLAAFSRSLKKAILVWSEAR